MSPSTLPGSVEPAEGILKQQSAGWTHIFDRRTWAAMPHDKRGFRRQLRLNPEAGRIARNEPQLRIIDADLWRRAN